MSKYDFFRLIWRVKLFQMITVSNLRVFDLLTCKGMSKMILNRNLLQVGRCEYLIQFFRLKIKISFQYEVFLLESSLGLSFLALLLHRRFLTPQMQL